MASTKVEGNRVTIDGMVYEVRAAGDEYYSVHDEFGETLGYLRFRGKSMSTDDYKLDGAPPLATIGRLWSAANAANASPSRVISRGVCHVAMHEGATDADLEAARAYRAWLKRQPGIRASYLARDPASGKAMSISLWQTRAHLDAALAAQAEGAQLAATTTETYPFVEEP
jgi:hypothetical protein